MRKNEKIQTAFLCLFLVGLLFAGCGTSQQGESLYKQITAEEAEQIMETETNYIILDVRTQEEYEEGHIPGAVCLPNEEIGETEIDELPEKEQTILVYCRSGNRSKRASEKLAKLGYTNVLEFGGIQVWPGEMEVS